VHTVKFRDQQGGLKMLLRIFVLSDRFASSGYESFSGDQV
jgi:hypothetical protein